MNFINILKDFEKELSLYNPSVLNCLNEGISSEMFENYIKDKKLKLPHNIAILYKWKNGFNRERTVHSELFFGGYFLDISYALEIYSIYSIRYKWGEFFFPLFSGIGDEIIFLGINDKNGSYGKLFIHDIYEGYSENNSELISYFDSLEKLFLTAIICYQNKVYSFDDEGSLTVDINLYRSICKKNNPNSEFWKI